MIDFAKLFGIAEAKQDNFGALFSKLQAILSELSEDDQHYITGFAGLLGSVAFADQHFSNEELAQAREVLKQTTTLNAEQTDRVIAVLKVLSEDLAGIEDYRYTRMIRDTCGRERKREVVSCLFQIAAADHSISAEENHRIQIISDNLQLSKQDFIDIRLSFKNHLEVLRK